MTHGSRPARLSSRFPVSSRQDWKPNPARRQAPTAASAEAPRRRHGRKPSNSLSRPDDTDSSPAGWAGPGLDYAESALARGDHHRFHRGDPPRSGQSPALSRAGLRPAPAWTATRRPSPTTTARSALTPIMPRPTSAAATPGPNWGGTRRPSRTTTSAVHLDPDIGIDIRGRVDPVTPAAALGWRLRAAVSAPDESFDAPGKSSTAEICGRSDGEKARPNRREPLRRGNMNAPRLLDAHLRSRAAALA